MFDFEQTFGFSAPLPCSILKCVKSLNKKSKYTKLASLSHLKLIETFLIIFTAWVRVLHIFGAENSHITHIKKQKLHKISDKTGLFKTFFESCRPHANIWSTMEKKINFRTFLIWGLSFHFNWNHFEWHNLNDNDLVI